MPVKVYHLSGTTANPEVAYDCFNVFERFTHEIESQCFSDNAMGSIRTDEPRHRCVFDFFFAVFSVMDNFDINLPWRLGKIAEFRSKLNCGPKLLEARTKNAFVVILS